MTVPAQLSLDNLHVAKVCFHDRPLGHVRRHSHDFGDAYRWTSYELRTGTFRTFDRYEMGSLAGTLDETKLARIRAAVAELVTGGPHESHDVASEQHRCALVLHDGEVAKPVFRVERVGFATDVVGRLLNEL